MPFDVTMPDGTVVKGVPDGTSKSDFDAKYQRNMSSSPVDKTVDNSLQQPMQQSTQGMPNLADAEAARGNVLKSAALGINAIGAGAQSALDVKNKASDVATDYIGKSYQKVMNHFPNAEKLSESGVELVSDGLKKAVSSPIGQDLMSALQSGATEYNKLAEKNPEAARAFQSLVSVGKLMGVMRLGGEQVADKTVVPLAKVVAKIGAEATGIPTVAAVVGGMGETAAEMKPATEKLHQTATNIIEKAKTSGATLSANLPDDAKKGIQDIVELSTSGDIANAEKTHSAVQKFIDSVSEKEIKGPGGKKQMVSGDLSLRNILGHQQNFNSIASSYAGSAESIAAKKVSEAIEKIINDALKNNEIKASNIKDVEGLNNFKGAWTKYQQHKTLVSALESAEDGSSKARNAMMKIRDSKFFNTYPAEAQRYINAGAKGRTRGGILDAVGKLKKIANFKTLGWTELAASLLHSPSLAIGAAAAGAVAHAAEYGGKNIAKSDIRKAIKEVEK